MSNDPVKDMLMLELAELLEEMERQCYGNAIEFSFFDDNTVVEIHTENSVYRLQVLDCDNCVVLATGNNRYLLEATKCRVNGCTWGGSAIKLSHVVVGGYLELQILDAKNDRAILTTSRIRRVIFRTILDTPA